MKGPVGKGGDARNTSILGSWRRRESDIKSINWGKRMMLPEEAKSQRKENNTRKSSKS